VPHMIPVAAAPNGIPSVHFATALLVAWICRYWRPGQILAFLYLILIGISTLASGQHYLFDLIVAVPYAIAAVYGASRLTPTETTKAAL
jgi:membrane-associated phospholipid phosphatase